MNSKYIETAACRYGQMSFYKNDDPIGKALRAYGQWAQDEIDLLGNLIGAGNSILDVGAYIGTHTVAFARLVGPSGSVHSFEPQPVSFELLKQNVDQNQLTWVTLYNKGIADQAGTISVPSVRVKEEPQNFGGLSLEDVDSKNSTEVELVSIDSLNLKELDLIKCDVEGFEEKVFSGAKETLKKFKPIIYSEVNDIESANAQINFLKEYGYKFYLHRAKVFDINNFNSETYNHFGFARETNLISISEQQVENFNYLFASYDLHQVSDQESVLNIIQSTKYYGDTWSNKDKLDQVNTIQALKDLKDLAQINEKQQKQMFTINDKLKEQTKDLQVLNDYRNRQQAAVNSLTSVMDSQYKALKNDFEKLQEALDRSNQSLFVKFKKLLKKIYQKLKMKIRPKARILKYYLDDLSLKNKYGLLLRKCIWKLSGSSARNQQMLSDYNIIEKSGLFDQEYYRATYSDLRSSKINPVLHYVKKGAALGFDPARFFNSEAYQRKHNLPDSINPFVHFIDSNLSQEEISEQQAFQNKLRKLAVKVGEKEWKQIEKNSNLFDYDGEIIDIIIPAYKNADELERCIYSLASSRAVNNKKFQIHVINDYSPESKLVEMLIRLSEEGLINQINNESNFGFVKTINRGFALNSDRDVLILNSDTEVYGNWLDRIYDAAYQNSDIATVTPLSNSATICSYPYFLKDFDNHYEIKDQEIDQILSQFEQELEEAPTGVGFCMYLKREALNEVGSFDEEAFGKGYGEENDFCARAINRGWKNVIANNVFVRHYGGSSFGQDLKDDLIQKGLVNLFQKHPNYQEKVDSFIKQDPLKKTRALLDAHRLKKSLGSKKVFLMITHSWGGGIERNVQDLIKYLEQEQGIYCLILRPDTKDENLLRLDNLHIPDLPNLNNFSIQKDTQLIIECLKVVGVKHVHLHSLVGSSFEDLVYFIPKLASSLNVNFDITLHDYAFICPRIHLMDKDGSYCGEPEVHECEKCIQKNSSPFGKPAVWKWREIHHQLLKQARKVMVPSADTAERFKKYYQDIEFIVQPHPETLALKQIGDHKLEVIKEDSNKTICIMGAIGPHKGSKELLQIIKDANSRNLPLKFVIIGYTNIDDQIKKFPNATVTGKYDEKDLKDLIIEYKPDIAFFPAVWPETYSYTLSLAFHFGIYPVAFNLGAIAERINSEYGDLIDFKYKSSPEKINDSFMKISKTDFPSQQKTQFSDFDFDNYYQLAL